MRFGSNIPLKRKKPPTEESSIIPWEAQSPISDVEAPQAGEARERVLAILPGLIKPRFLGMRSVYTLVVTDRRLIFARTKPVRSYRTEYDDKKRKKGWLQINKWRRQDETFNIVNYWEMEPDDILRQTLVNFDIQLRDVRRVRVREEIPFILKLDPNDLLKRDLDYELDDIVLEIPDKPRKRLVKEFQEDVEMVWMLRIDSVKANLSFLLEYNPKGALKPFLVDKMD